MKPTQMLLLGLAAAGFVLALPAQADTNRSESMRATFNEGGFVLVKGDSNENRVEPRREQRDEQPVKNGKRFTTRDADRVDFPGYGYGYERRQQHVPVRDEDNRNRR